MRTNAKVLQLKSDEKMDTFEKWHKVHDEQNRAKMPDNPALLQLHFLRKIPTLTPPHLQNLANSAGTSQLFLEIQIIGLLVGNNL